MEVYSMNRIQMIIITTLFFLVSVITPSFLYSHSEASDYYIGRYNDGNEAYLVTDTIHETIMSHRGYFDGYKYDCKVKSVFPDTREYYYIDYTFPCWCPGDPAHWIKDNTEYRKRSQSDFPVEYALIAYFYDYSQNRHPNQWKSEKVLGR